jgi:protein-S-isoprenylcysteine O-methyltransferase Ste14
MVDRPNTIPWPPLLFAGAALAGWLIHRWLPLDLPGGTATRAAGAVLVTLALVIDLWAALTFKRHRTSILPHRGASRLISSGPFAYARNPIYIANTLLVAGIGLFSHLAWLLPAALAGAAATHFLAVRREEKHLASRFGAEWQAYASAVRRWGLF